MSKDIKKKIVPVLQEYPVSRAALFGSRARGDYRKDSDTDILVDIKKGSMSLLDFVGLKQDLEEALGGEVDLVQYSRIKPRLREYILGSEIPIFP